MSPGQVIPLHAWTKLATDIFYFEGASYLLFVDYTSRFLVVHKLSFVTGQHKATHCKQGFSEYGWPQTLISDNEPCYRAEAFINMMKEYGVNDIISSPHSNPIDWLRNMFKLSKTCSTRLKRKERTCLNV